MGKVTFTNSKIDTAIVDERQRYRSSVTSAERRVYLDDGE